LKPGEEARSLVCNECGKRFRSQAQAEFHASKTEHVDFSESTEEIAPLTEEEKAARLEELRVKLAEKRALQAEQEKAERKKNEVRNGPSRPTGFKVLMRYPDSANPQEEHKGNPRYQGGFAEERATKRGSPGKA
jgi:hypothetical protein